MFVLMYAILLIAAGAITIEDWHRKIGTLNGSKVMKDKALAMGSMALIGGIVMLVDCALILKSILKK